MDEDIDELKEKQVCWECIGEKYLKSQIQLEGKKAICSYCDSNLQCFNVGFLSKIVDKAFQQHYYLTSDQMSSIEERMHNDDESNYAFERSGDEITDAIGDAANIDQELAVDIQRILEDKYYDPDPSSMDEECEYSTNSCYQRKDIDEEPLLCEWQNVEKIIKSQSRFFNRKVSKILKSTFEGINELTTNDGTSPIVEAGPGTGFNYIFRARTFQSDEALRLALKDPETQLGPPPSTSAVPGRMNAKGISVFYGAESEDAAISEVRPPVGSQVLVGKFEICRSIKLLDITILKEINTQGSIFDPEYITQLERASFLSNLSSRIVTPVMPDDHESEYLPTQAIADFLANRIKPIVHGLIFPSVQSTSQNSNIVLFHKFSRVKISEDINKSIIEVEIGESTDDGNTHGYNVFTYEKNTIADNNYIPHTSPITMNDRRMNTLKLVRHSLNVHIIKAISLKTEKFAVKRY